MSDENGDALRAKLLEQIRAMIEYLSDEGREVPEDAYAAFSPDTSLTKLGAINHRLAKLVTPARPETLALFSRYGHENKGNPLRRLLRVPLARTFISLALVSLILVLVFSSSKLVMNQGVVLQDGAPPEPGANLSFVGFLLSLAWYAYLVAAALLGAVFAALFNINRYILDLSYDDTHEPAHVLRVFIGTVAGAMLSIILVQQDVVDLQGTEGAAKSISVAVLALLGGFSGTLVYRVLQRLVSAIETIMDEDPRDYAGRVEREIKAKAAAATAETQKTDAAKLQAALSRISADPKAAETELRKLLEDKLGVSSEAVVRKDAQMEARKEMLAKFLDQVLQSKSLTLTPEHNTEVARANVEQLEAWLARALSSSTVEDVFEAQSRT